MGGGGGVGVGMLMCFVCVFFCVELFLVLGGGGLGGVLPPLFFFWGGALYFETPDLEVAKEGKRERNGEEVQRPKV